LDRLSSDVELHSLNGEYAINDTVLCRNSGICYLTLGSSSGKPNCLYIAQMQQFVIYKFNLRITYELYIADYTITIF